MTDHEMQSQGLAAQKDRLFCDLKTDEEKAAFFLSGRGYESGVIAHSIQNDVAMAYHRCSEYLKEMEKLQAENERLREKVGLIICDECHAKCSEPYTGLFASHCHDEEPCIMCECSSLRRQLASLSGGAGGEHEEDRVMEQPAEQQPTELEILGSYPVSGQIFFREPSNEWVLELTGSINGTRFTARHTQPADTRPEDVAGLPALYELAPDVSAMVEALQTACEYLPIGSRALELASIALAAHRKQGGE